MSNIRDLLERFIVKNEDLTKIEIELNNFNIFEKLSIQYYELRHSNTLAYLLNPKENHGLSDYFLKKFFIEVFSNNSSEISPIQIDCMDLSDSIIKREYKNIDILVISNSNKIVFCIENKITANESNDQLERYQKIINKEFFDYNKAFIFLSPTGIEPSDTENWMITDYEVISSIIENIINLKSKDLGEQQLFFIDHYNKIIRRYLLENSLENELARRIYNNHKIALDFIFKNIVDQRNDFYEYIKQIIQNDSNLIISHSTKSRIRFQTRKMNELLPKIGDKSWNKVKEIFLYEIKNNTDFINIILVIGPGDQKYREKTFNFIKNDFLKKYLGSNSSLATRYNTIYKKEIISKDDFDNMEYDEIKEKIKEFFENDAINQFKSIDDYFENNIKIFQE